MKCSSAYLKQTITLRSCKSLPHEIELKVTKFSTKKNDFIHAKFDKVSKSEGEKRDHEEWRLKNLLQRMDTHRHVG